MKFINKLVLSLFRLFAIGFIGYYLAKIIKKNEAPIGYIVLITMVLAGAAGNLIDCLFYGLIFDAQHHLQSRSLFRLVRIFYIPSW